MTPSSFDKIVRSAYAKLPAKFKRILKKEGVQIIARDKPPAVLEKEHKGDWLFGVFVGPPYRRQSVFETPFEPTRIELYKKSFEAAFKTRREMEEQIGRTVIHEVGHYFGFSEEELEEYLERD